MANRSSYRKPNIFLVGIVKAISKLACTLLFRIRVIRNELKGSSGRRVIIANHESAVDFLTAYAVMPRNTSLVASRSIVHSLPIYPLVPMMGILEKNQFQTTVGDMRRMKSVLNHDGLLMLYPAGLMTESGASTPIPLGTGRVLKWFDADVYVSKVSGTYLSSPKWSKVRRRGRGTLDVYKLISREELAALSDREAQALVESHLYFDAYRDSEKNRIPFKHGDNVEGLEHVLYKCPACGEEFTMGVRSKNTLLCSACGYEVSCDSFGLLSAPEGKEALFRYPSDWHAHIERFVRNSVLENPGFLLTTRAAIHKINDKKHRYEPVGEGTVTLSFDRFTIDGTVHGQPFSKKIPTASFPMLPFQPGKRFEIQLGEDIFRILPEDGRVVMKWLLTLKSVYHIKRDKEAAAT